MHLRLVWQRVKDRLGELMGSLDALSGSGIELEMSHLLMRLDHLQERLCTLEAEMERLRCAPGAGGSGRTGRDVSIEESAGTADTAADIRP